jgi:hypothetical protein
MSPVRDRLLSQIPSAGSRGSFHEEVAFVIPTAWSVGEATEEYAECSVVSTDARRFGIRSGTIGDGDLAYLACEPAPYLPLDGTLQGILGSRVVAG